MKNGKNKLSKIKESESKGMIDLKKYMQDYEEGKILSKSKSSKLITEETVKSFQVLRNRIDHLNSSQLVIVSDSEAKIDKGRAKKVIQRKVNKWKNGKRESKNRENGRYGRSKRMKKDEIVKELSKKGSKASSRLEKRRMMRKLKKLNKKEVFGKNSRGNMKLERIKEEGQGKGRNKNGGMEIEGEVKLRSSCEEIFNEKPSKIGDFEFSTNTKTKSDCSGYNDQRMDQIQKEIKDQKRSIGKSSVPKEAVCRELRTRWSKKSKEIQKLNFKIKELERNNEREQASKQKHKKLREEEESKFRIESEEYQKKLKYCEEEFKKLNDTISRLSSLNSKKDKELRAYHKHLQRRQGNMRTFIRLRPPSTQDSQQQCTTVNPKYENQVEFLSERSNSFKKYFYNKVFGVECTQEQIFENVKPFVKSSLLGIPVCIFAYGQTGSGKTFTILGKNKQGESTPSVIAETSGIIPRTFDYILSELKDLNCIVETGCIEIYNEKLVDLLDKDNKELRISLKKNRCELVNMTKRRIRETRDIISLISTSQENRRVAATMWNEESSRSHLIFLTTISVVDENGVVLKSGKLSIVDLAGSEKNTLSRVEKTPMSVRIQNEANCINKSLTELGKVIRQKKARDLQNGRVKKVKGCYRGSKLTQILGDAFDGEGEVLMITNVRVESEFNNETKRVLNFSGERIGG